MRVPSGVRRPVRAALLSRDRSPVVLDVVYVLGVIALFVIVGLIGKAVEKL
jgi:hypothetical protein